MLPIGASSVLRPRAGLSEARVHKRLKPITLIAGLLLLATCHSGTMVTVTNDPGDPSQPATPANALWRIATARCTAWSVCPWFPQAFPGIMQCRTRIMVDAVSFTAAANYAKLGFSTLDSGQFAKCIAQMQATTCELPTDADFSYNAFYEQCDLTSLFVGEGANGTPCGVSWRCKSAWCDGATDSSCGFCRQYNDYDANNPCGRNDGGCGARAFCKNDSRSPKQCQAYGQAGQPCDSATFCRYDLVCHVDADGNASHCQAKVGFDQSCNDTSDCDNNLICLDQPGGRHCSARPKLGESCNQHSDCADDMACERHPGDAVHVCHPRVKIGEDCTGFPELSGFHLECVREAKCLGVDGNKGLFQCLATAAFGRSCASSSQCTDAGGVCVQGVCRMVSMCWASILFSKAIECPAALVPGDTCVKKASRCGYGLQCTQQKCVPWREVDEPCGVPKDLGCAPGLHCGATGLCSSALICK